MSIPPADPKAGYLAHREEILAAVKRVLDSGQYILGPEVDAFEREFAAYLGAAGSVGVASGTDALHIALRALGVGPGDSVLTVSHTAVATVAAIEMAGATPVLVDIDEARMTMDPDSLEATIAALRAQRRFRAVIPVHLYGQPAEVGRIAEICRREGLALIEDCAQAHGAQVDGRMVGTFGELGAFSFYPTKNLGALGDAGALAAMDAGLLDRVRALREYGWQERYVSAEPGVSSRLDPLQAAILRVNLQYLDTTNKRRREIAFRYTEALHGSCFELPVEVAGERHVYHQYVIRSDQRDRLQAHLSAAGVKTLIHYPAPVHLQPAYAGRTDCSPGGLPVTERVCREVLSIPVHPELEDSQVLQVIDSLRSFEA